MVDLDDGERKFITEMVEELGEIHRTYLTENVEAFEMLLIQEGFFDKLVDLKNAAKTKISDYAKRVRDAVTFVIDKLKEWISETYKHKRCGIKNDFFINFPEGDVHGSFIFFKHFIQMRFAFIPIPE